jgi:uncharacterized protein with PIN domain
MKQERDFMVRSKCPDCKGKLVPLLAPLVFVDGARVKCHVTELPHWRCKACSHVFAVEQLKS